MTVWPIVWLINHNSRCHLHRSVICTLKYIDCITVLQRWNPKNSLYKSEKKGKKRQYVKRAVRLLHQWSLCDAVHMNFCRLLQGWSADIVKTMFLDSDWWRVSGLCSDRDYRCWTSRWGEGAENIEVFRAQRNIHQCWWSWCSQWVRPWSSVLRGNWHRCQSKGQSLPLFFLQVACMMGFSGAKCTPLLHIWVLQFLVPMHFKVASKRKKTPLSYGPKTEMKSIFSQGRFTGIMSSRGLDIVVNMHEKTKGEITQCSTMACEEQQEYETQMNAFSAYYSEERAYGLKLQQCDLLPRSLSVLMITRHSFSPNRYFKGNKSVLLMLQANLIIICSCSVMTCSWKKREDYSSLTVSCMALPESYTVTIIHCCGASGSASYEYTAYRRVYICLCDGSISTE